MKRCAVCIFLCLAMLLCLASAALAAEERGPLRVIFPSAGIPHYDELTVVSEDGIMTTAVFPLPWDMLGDCLRLVDASALFGDTVVNMRYIVEDRGYGLVTRNQMIAYQHDSAGVIALTVEQIPDGTDRLELEIGGFTRLSLETMPEPGDCLYMFYGIGGAEVTLSAWIISAENEMLTPDPILLKTAETEPQPASFSLGEDEVKLTARFLDMADFLAQMPLTNPVPTGIEVNPMEMINPS